MSGANGYTPKPVIYDKQFCLSVAGTSKHYVAEGEDVSNPSVKTKCGGTGFPMREKTYPNMRICAKCLSVVYPTEGKEERRGRDEL